MKTRIQGVAVFAAAIVLLGAGLARAQEAETLLDPYFRIHASLSSDSLDGVAADAKAIAEHAKKMGAPGEQMHAAATELSAAGDLEKARAAFGQLSDAFIDWAERTDAKLGDGVVMYCPMVDKSWVQKGEAVKNPYYGSAMLTCGEKKKKKTN